MRLRLTRFHLAVLAYPITIQHLLVIQRDTSIVRGWIWVIPTLFSEGANLTVMSMTSSARLGRVSTDIVRVEGFLTVVRGRLRWLVWSGRDATWSWLAAHLRIFKLSSFLCNWFAYNLAFRTCSLITRRLVQVVLWSLHEHHWSLTARLHGVVGSRGVFLAKEIWLPSWPWQDLGVATVVARSNSLFIHIFCSVLCTIFVNSFLVHFCSTFKQDNLKCLLQFQSIRL